jgi:crotonobetainyl-CoA:carnitine CoA-transferase CaiB-like acyl-CoA transferase
VKLALAGLKIVDLSRFAPGPFCTMILGDLGADIIKVEENNLPAKDPAATSKSLDKIPMATEFATPDSPFNPLNRNKRSIKINLKMPQGKEIMQRLAAKADVVVEGFRPGVTRRLGIDYTALSEINPRLIYCAVTGYGQDGPYAQLPGHDINYAAIGGAIDTISLPGSIPQIPANFLGDMAGGGMQAAIGILAAIYARQTTGKGQFVDISMTDGVCSMMGLYLSRYYETGTAPALSEKVSCGAVPFYGCYETSDNKYIAIACSEPWFFANLCKVLGCENFIPLQMDQSKAAEMSSFFKAKFHSQSSDFWFETLLKADVPVSKVNALAEIGADPQIKHRQMVVPVKTQDGKSVNQVGIGIKLSDTPGQIRSIGDRPGESTTRILAEIGYTQSEIQHLLTENVVGQLK